MIRLAPPYRTKLNRHYGYDDRQPGVDFVTLCRHDPRIFFGSVAGIGLDSVVLMPDHLHGIIVLGADLEVQSWPSLGEIVGRFKSVSNRRYFANVRKGAWPPIDRRVWQLRYHDRIDRSDRELDRMREYSAANPDRWEARRRGDQ